MYILTSPTFWIIIGAIILIMALIGYLAEGTDFANKALDKTKKENNPAPTTVSEVVPTPININAESQPSSNISENQNNGIVSTDSPIEVLNVQGEPSAWTDDAPKVDEKMETVHNVTSLDDWSVIPNTTELPEVKLENPNETPANNDPMFPDIKPSDLESTPITEPTINNENTEENIWKA